MSRLQALVVAGVVALMASATAWADGGHWHRHAYGGPRVSLAIGPYWGPWYHTPFPPMYERPTVVIERPAAPTVYIEQAPAASAPIVVPPANGANSYWYYCDATEAYWPYVKECPGGWQRIVPRPPGQ